VQSYMEFKTPRQIVMMTCSELREYRALLLGTQVPLLLVYSGGGSDAVSAGRYFSSETVKTDRQIDMVSEVLRAKGCNLELDGAS